MPEPRTLRADLDQFFRDRGIDPDTLQGTPEDDSDPHGQQEHLRLAAEYADQHIPARYAGAVADHPPIVDWIHRVADQAAADSAGNVASFVRTGPSILVLGITGVGKTHQAYGAMRKLAELGVRAKWAATTAADMYAALRPRHGVDSEAEFRSYAAAPLLVVDDLGAAKNSEWVEDVNLRLINWRYDRVLPTMFTSNLKAKELSAQLGDRVASRLIEMTERVVLEGDDRRRVAT